MQEIIELISTVGFPIAMCLALVFQGVSYLNRLESEIDTLKTALNNNTLVMQRILDRLGVSEDVKEL